MVEAIMNHTTARILLCALLAAPLSMSSLAATPGGEASAPSVHIDNFTFSPKEITIPLGGTVTWVNDDDIPQALATTDKAFRSKAMDTEEKFSFTFNKPGTYAYFCSLHPHMQGKVIVRE